jgi:hypothetical protein
MKIKDISLFVTYCILAKEKSIATIIYIKIRKFNSVANDKRLYMKAMLRLETTRTSPKTLWY